MVNKNETTSVMKDEKKHTYHDDNQETTPGHELEVDEGDDIEGLKKKRKNLWKMSLNFYKTDIG